MRAGTLKPVEFIGDSLDELRGFPQSARREAGFQLDLVQRGLDPADWKPMPGIGSGVCEVRIRDTAGVFRVLYVAKFAEAVYVLHCFHKKSARTAKKDLDVAESRYRELMKGRQK